MPELLFVFLEKCLTLVLVHFCSLMLDIDDTLKQKGNTVLKSWHRTQPLYMFILQCCLANLPYQKHPN